MSHDFFFVHRKAQIHHALGWVPRQQNSAAASSASSPGRRTGALRAPDTSARGNSDIFTRHGTTHHIMRFYPGAHKPEPLIHRTATAEIPTHGETVCMPVTITARTPQLTHVIWIDETGEIIGTWCPTTMVGTAHEPQEPGEHEHR